MNNILLLNTVHELCFERGGGGVVFSQKAGRVQPHLEDIWEKVWYVLSIIHSSDFLCMLGHKIIFFFFFLFHWFVYSKSSVLNGKFHVTDENNGIQLQQVVYLQKTEIHLKWIFSFQCYALPTYKALLYYVTSWDCPFIQHRTHHGKTIEFKKSNPTTVWIK